MTLSECKKRHYERRRAAGYSALCAAHKHVDCRICDCPCHDNVMEAA